MAKQKWIKSAIKRPGAFKAKAEAAGKSTREYASEKADAPGRLGKEARLAETLMGMKGGRSEDDRKSTRYGKKG